MKVDELAVAIAVAAVLVAVFHKSGAGRGLVDLLKTVAGAEPRVELDRAARESRAYETMRAELGRIAAAAGEGA